MNNYKGNIESGEFTDLVLDTGVLITYLTNLNTPSTQWLDKYVFSETSVLNLYISEIQRAEIFYVLCRHKGELETRKIFQDKINAIFTFILDEDIGYMAGKIKWKNTIALTDCFCIATAIYLNCPCVFLKEKEMPEIKLNAIESDFQAKFVLFDK